MSEPLSIELAPKYNCFKKALIDIKINHNHFDTSFIKFFKKTLTIYTTNLYHLG